MDEAILLSSLTKLSLITHRRRAMESHEKSERNIFSIFVTVTKPSNSKFFLDYREKNHSLVTQPHKSHENKHQYFLLTNSSLLTDRRRTIYSVTEPNKEHTLSRYTTEDITYRHSSVHPPLPHYYHNNTNTLYP